MKEVYEVFLLFSFFAVIFVIGIRKSKSNPPYVNKKMDGKYVERYILSIPRGYHFAREYHFDRMNESILITIFPYVLAIVVLILLCMGLRKIRRR